MPWKDMEIANECQSLCKKIILFTLRVLPYVGLVLLGHTATSLDKHAKGWHWGRYLVSCVSAATLGVAIFFLVDAIGLTPPWGYALAVLAGHNSKDTLDLFSKDVIAAIRKYFKP